MAVGKRARAAAQVAALSPDATDDQKRRAHDMAEGGDLAIGDLGSGSDYTPFVQHLGIASINFDFGSESEQGGVYHSLYDDFEHYERFGDPTGDYGVAMSQVAGRMVLRAADAEVVPLQAGDLAKAVAAKVEDLHKLADTMRQRSEAVDKAVEGGAYALADDPLRRSVVPAHEDAVPAIAFAPLDAAVARLKASAELYDRAAALAPEINASRAAYVDALLQGLEQTLTDDRGLPGRPWYKHLIYAPGVLTGYGAKTIPGVREAIEGRRWSEADEYAARTAAVLNACSDRLLNAAAVIGRRSGVQYGGQSG
jgi:N-acetylated-alpha-linked acidic dipeptidase